jgi:plastocyanin
MIKHMKAGLAAAAVSVVVAALACFSDRDGVTGPGEGDCNALIASQSQIAGSVIVVIRDYEFEPANLTVARNTKVTWINCGPLEVHTSTSTGNWNSGDISTGAIFTRSFATAGAFDYFCIPHPFMTGRITVQ